MAILGTNDSQLFLKTKGFKYPAILSTKLGPKKTLRLQAFKIKLESQLG